jgi:glutathione S-transferase
VTIPTVDVDMLKGENATADYLAKNPMGKMPLLELDDGTMLAESMAICRYIEELHPAPPLFGTTARERALIEMWNRRMELELLAPVSDVFIHTSPFWVGRRTQIAAWGEHQRERAQTFMAWLDGVLANRAHIAGETYTVADITAQAACVLGRNTGTPIAPELVNLTRWYRSVTSRPTARA